MAAEIPVMTSNRGAMAEVGGDCAVLVNPENVEEMAHKMDTLTWDRSVIEDLQIRGLERARSWDWAETARQTCEVYHRVLDNK
jgi:glycosyltransferase involved in cell wall biosynthesis